MVSKMGTFVGVDGSRWEIEVSDDPGVTLAAADDLQARRERE